MGSPSEVRLSLVMAAYILTAINKKEKRGKRLRKTDRRMKQKVIKFLKEINEESNSPSKEIPLMHEAYEYATKRHPGVDFDFLLSITGRKRTDPFRCLLAKDVDDAAAIRNAIDALPPSTYTTELRAQAADMTRDQVFDDLLRRAHYNADQAVHKARYKNKLAGKVQVSEKRRSPRVTPSYAQNTVFQKMKNAWMQTCKLRREEKNTHIIEHLLE